jgi:hypothetical protein
MVIDYFNILSGIINPAKAYTKLIVDSNAVLSRAIPLEQLQVIPWRIPKVIQALCSMNHFQLSPCNASNRTKLLRRSILKELSCLRASKA